MKKIVLLFSMLFILAITNEMKAQDYKSAIGLRFGYPVSISYKTFLSESNALELYLGYRGYSGIYGYWTLGGLYEFHKPIADVEGLSWYYGFGASVQFFTYDEDYWSGLEDEGAIGVGLSGVIGLDYKFPSAPVNLSLDFVPTFRLGGWDDGYYSWGALSARYVLN